MKKHYVRNGVLAVIMSILLAFGIAALVGVAQQRRIADNVNEQLSVGIRYLDELNYEAAIACFMNVIKIDDKNVAAYMGMALAYEGLGDQKNAFQILANGIDATESSILEKMLQDGETGRKLLEIYSFQETDTLVEVSDNPFQSLKLLGSDFYQWDFSTCAELFGFDYERYAGTSVALGTFEGFQVKFDATNANVEFSMENSELIYGYKMLGSTQLQIFEIKTKGRKTNLSVIKEIDCRLSMEFTYEDFLSQTGLGALVPEENVYYLTDSSIGKIGYIQWHEGMNTTYACIFMLNGKQLCMQLIFSDGELSSVKYGCEMPDNLRSKALNWLNSLIN